MTHIICNPSLLHIPLMTPMHPKYYYTWQITCMCIVILEHWLTRGGGGGNCQWDPHGCCWPPDRGEESISGRNLCPIWCSPPGGSIKPTCDTCVIGLTWSGVAWGVGVLTWGVLGLEKGTNCSLTAAGRWLSRRKMAKKRGAVLLLYCKIRELSE